MIKQVFAFLHSQDILEGIKIQSPRNLSSDAIASGTPKGKRKGHIDEQKRAEKSSWQPCFMESGGHPPPFPDRIVRPTPRHGHGGIAP